MAFESPVRTVRVGLGSTVAAIADSRRRIVLCSFALAGAATFFEFVVHEFISAFHFSNTVHAAIDAITIGCGTGVFTAVWLSAYRARRQKFRQEIEKVGELNHQVRNALEVIVASQYVPDAERARLVLDSVDRIDVTLRDLFPLPHHGGSWRDQ